MNISEVRELLLNAPTETQLAELAQDQRAGVRKMLAAYYKRQKQAEVERERFHKMMSYERQYYAEGTKLIAGVDEAGRGPLAGP